MAAAADLHMRRFPTLRVRSSASDYNCVGLVFASRRTWVEPRYVSRFLEEDGYRKVELRDAQPGDVILYRGEAGTVDHVGLVINHEPNVANADWDTTVLSQWGRDGEFLHERRDVSPLFAASTVEVWTERRV